LLARYADAGLACASASVMGFQEDSEKVVAGSARRDSSRMAANEEVMTTRRTVGAEVVMERRRAVVPITAGSMSSWMSSARG
jgi:hypothetical protein